MGQLTSGAGSGVRTALLIGLVAAGVAACGGGGGDQSTASASSTTTSSSSATTSSSSATTSPTSSSSSAFSSSGTSSQAEAQIKQNWTAFFDAKTPADQKARLLQNGQQLTPFIQQMAQSPLAQGVSAQVSNVTVNGQTATVTYSILVNGQPALPNQTGQAVLENGTWKVGTSSFCSLLALQGSAPPVCPSASGSASSTAAASTTG